MKPNRGGFVPIGELAGTLPGLVQRGRAMSANTRHHFTTLRQVQSAHRGERNGRRHGLHGAAARAVQSAAHQP